MRGIVLFDARRVIECTVYGNYFGFWILIGREEEEDEEWIVVSNVT